MVKALHAPRRALNPDRRQGYCGLAPGCGSLLRTHLLARSCRSPPRWVRSGHGDGDGSATQRDERARTWQLPPRPLLENTPNGSLKRVQGRVQRVRNSVGVRRALHGQLDLVVLVHRSRRVDMSAVARHRVAVHWARIVPFGRLERDARDQTGAPTWWVRWRRWRRGWTR